MNAFLAALLVRSASALPFHEYPYDSRYGQWRLLGFSPPNGAKLGEIPPLKPEPDSPRGLQTEALLMGALAHAGPHVTDLQALAVDDLDLLAGNMKRMAAAYRLRLAMRARQLNAEPQIWDGNPIDVDQEESLLLEEDKRRPAHPYPGLRSFEPGEGEIFFGRRHNVEAVRELLASNRVVAVLGGSGSGKSSLLRAGLLPYLNTRQCIRGRVGNWYSAEFRPRTQAALRNGCGAGRASHAASSRGWAHRKKWRRRSDRPLRPPQTRRRGLDARPLARPIRRRSRGRKRTRVPVGGLHLHRRTTARSWPTRPPPAAVGSRSRACSC